MEVVQQKITKILRTPVTDLESNGSAITAGFELALERMYEIFYLFVVDIEVAVPGDAKLIAALDVHAGETGLQHLRE